MTTNSLGNKFVLILRGSFYTGAVPSERPGPSAEEEEKAVGAEPSAEEEEEAPKNYRHNLHGPKGRFVKKPRLKGK